jgi:proline iminopeptidase
MPSHWPKPSHLPLPAPHRTAFRVIGARSGDPWLLLHGGPGASCQPGMLAPLDLGTQWAVAVDQRGCGGSRPLGKTARNTTPLLVSDLEALRRSLGVARWNVLAGSWGTVVALAYVQRHPERVGRMVLRGAFGVGRRELAGLLQPGAGIRHTAGPLRSWPRAPGYGVPSVLAALRKVIQSGTLGVAGLRAVRHWNRLEMACALAGMRRSLRHAAAHADAALALRIRRDLAQLQRGMRRAKAWASLPRARPADKRLQAKYRVQGHYLSHRGFVRPGDLDAAVRSAARSGIDIDWVHGRFDAVCPSANSQTWARQGPGRSGAGRLHLTRAGHLGHEADTLDVLRKVVRGATGRQG